MKTTHGESLEPLLKLSSGKGLSLVDLIKILSLPPEITTSCHLEPGPALLQLDAPELSALQEAVLAFCKADFKLLYLIKNRLESVLINPAFRTPDTTPDLFRFLLRFLYALRDLIRPASSAAPNPVRQPVAPQPADSIAMREAECHTDVVEKFIMLRAHDVTISAAAESLAVALRTAQEWDSQFRGEIVYETNCFQRETLRRNVLGSHKDDLPAFHKRTESVLISPFARAQFTVDMLRLQLQILYDIQDLSHSAQAPATPPPPPPASDAQNPQKLAA